MNYYARYVGVLVLLIILGFFFEKYKKLFFVKKCLALDEQCVYTLYIHRSNIV